VLLLEAGGLGVVLDDTRIEHLPFGTTASTVRRVVTRLVGAPVTAAPDRLRAGPPGELRRRWLELLFRGTRFVGWTDTGYARPSAHHRRRDRRRPSPSPR
jgi:hypothetical protein